MALRNINNSASMLSHLNLIPLQNVPDLMTNFNNLHTFIKDWTTKESPEIVNTISDLQKAINLWDNVTAPKLKALASVSPPNKTDIINEFGSWESSLTSVQGGLNNLDSDLTNMLNTLADLLNRFQIDLTEITNDENRDRNEINRLKMEVNNLLYQLGNAIANIFKGHSVTATISNDKAQIARLTMELNREQRDLPVVTQIVNLLGIIIQNIKIIDGSVKNIVSLNNSIIPDIQHVPAQIASVPDSQVDMFVGGIETRVSGALNNAIPLTKYILG